MHKCGILIDMKKIKLLFFPAILACCLSSCSTIDKEHSILACINYEVSTIGADNDRGYVDFSYEITPFRLHELLDHEASFPLYVYGEYCSHCDNFKPILGKYIKNTGRQFYKCTFTTQEEYDFVVNDYPEIFANYIGTPAMFFIENGKLTYQVANGKFSSYNAFATIVNKHFFSGNLYTVNTLDGLKYYLNDHKNTLIYCYDDASEVSIELHKTIYEKMKDNKSKDVLILNKNEISDTNYQAICGYFDLYVDDIFAIYVNSNEQQKTADYTVNGGNAFKQFLATYFH